MANGWHDISIKERIQIINGTALVISAIALYFLAFMLTLSIGLDVVSAGATLLATGLAFFGLTSFVKSQLLEFETKLEKRLSDNNTTTTNNNV